MTHFNMNLCRKRLVFWTSLEPDPQQPGLQVKWEKKCCSLPPLNRFGVGDTISPIGITRCLHEKGAEADTSVKAAREEGETVIFGVVKEALAKTRTKPKDIDIIIVNCSLFSPTPSLCSMVSELIPRLHALCLSHCTFFFTCVIPLDAYNLGYSSLWNEE